MNDHGSRCNEHISLPEHKNPFAGDCTMFPKSAWTRWTLWKKKTATSKNDST